MERVLLQQANSLLLPAKKVRIKSKFHSFYKTLVERLEKITPSFFYKIGMEQGTDDEMSHVSTSPERDMLGGDSLCAMWQQHFICTILYHVSCLYNNTNILFLRSNEVSIYHVSAYSKFLSSDVYKSSRQIGKVKVRVSATRPSHAKTWLQSA